MHRSFFVGLPGLEPGKAGPESAVLPLHHSPIISGAKVAQVHRTAKHFSKFFQNIFITIIENLHIQGLTQNKKVQGGIPSLHFTCHFPYEVALYLPQRLLNVCYQILHILYTYREADKVWCHTSLTQLLVSKLSMSMTCRM